MERRRTVRLKCWKPAPETPSHVVDRIPEGTVIVDVREPEEEPQVGDLRLPFSRALESLDRLDKSRTYLLMCASG